MEIQERIIHGARELFFKFGIKSVTMDEIARHLAISKKTLYQYYQDKEELVCKIAEMRMGQEAADIQNIMLTAKDPLDELIKISELIKRYLREINPTIFLDLQRYHPKAWQIFESHKQCCYQDSITQNLEKGKELGWYRKELNTKILSKIRMEIVQTGLDYRIFPHQEFDFVEVQIQLFEHFVYGLLTPKGYEIWEEYKKKNYE